MEELHLLDGELWIDERKLVPGDYNYGAPGAGDERVWSETGCTCRSRHQHRGRAISREASMIAYRCYLLDEDGHIRNSQVIECLTDAAALEEAERRLATADCSAIEVWDKARRVGTAGHARDYWDPGGEKTSDQHRFLLDATLVQIGEKEQGDGLPLRPRGLTR